MKPQVRNEILVNAAPDRIWSVITDIDLLHKVNPGVIKASGRMDKLNETRICEIDNNGRKGTMTEKLIELVPNKKTVWTIENDTMGMSKMLHDTRFVFILEPIGNERTRVTSETHYQPANLIARIMSSLVMKRMIGKAQEQILNNIRSLTEK